MKVLVANLGSTSFKYRLYDMTDESQLARGGIERIGQDAEGTCFVEIAGKREQVSRRIADHAEAVRICLEQLTHPQTGCIQSVEEVSAIGFKAVFAGKLSGVRIVNDELLDAMEALADVAPAHNPPYARAMRQLRAAFPKMPLVAALETGFHETVPAEYRTYAVPYEWTELGILRWGYHGASHRYIGTRMGQILGRSDLKVISCHLGGSNSICAMVGGVSQSASMGMTPQTGLPHNNRVGDFDPYAIPVIMRATGKTFPQVLEDLSSKGRTPGNQRIVGRLPRPGRSRCQGHARAALAMNVFAASIRQYIGSYLTVLNGADAIVFTGGIGENSQWVRTHATKNLDFAGIKLDESLNKTAKGEAKLSTADSRTQIWTLPTNEEIVVARQSVEAVKGLGPRA
jgi:acetate kinase